MRGPGVFTASVNEPGPSAARLVTRRILPPRPPGVCAAQPWAPGKAVSGLSLAWDSASGTPARARTNSSQAARITRSLARRSTPAGRWCLGMSPSQEAGPRCQAELGPGVAVL